MKKKRIYRLTACFLSVMLIAGIVFGWNGAKITFADDTEEQGVITEDFEDYGNPEEPFAGDNDSFSENDPEENAKDFIPESEEGSDGEPSLGSGSSDETPDATQDNTDLTSPVPGENDENLSEDMQTDPTTGTSDTDEDEEISTASNKLEGTYTGSWEETVKNETVMYEATLVLNAGRFAYYIRTIADCMDYDDTEKIVGTYTESNGDIQFDDGLNRLESGTLENGILSINGVLTSFSTNSKFLKMQKETDGVEVITSPKRTDYLSSINPNGQDSNGLRSGKYSLTEQSYDSSAVLKPYVDLVIDAEKLTFVFLDSHGVEKAKGLLEYNTELSCYEILYNDEEEEEYEEDDVDDGDEDEDYDEGDDEDDEDYSSGEEEGDISGNAGYSSSDFEEPVSDFEADSPESSVSGSAFAVSGVTDDEDDDGDEYSDDEEEETEGFVLSGTGIRFMEAIRFGDGYINTLNDEGDFLPYTAAYALDQSFDYSDEVQFEDESSQVRSTSGPTVITTTTATPQPTVVARTTTTANTGDENTVWIYCLMAALAAAGIVLAVRKKKA